MKSLMRLFHLVRDERAVLDHWLKLVVEFQVVGKNAHDARLVAAMQRHGIEHVLTLNPSDFSRYKITVRTPLAILNS